jgi:hypothetical protein
VPIVAAICGIGLIAVVLWEGNMEENGFEVFISPR